MPTSTSHQTAIFQKVICIFEIFRYALCPSNIDISGYNCNKVSGTGVELGVGGGTYYFSFEQA